MLIRAVRRRWRHWVNRRIPRADEQCFTQKNIFILPSGAGVVFGALLLIMLLTGINYQNSLIYLLTFILGALFVAAMHQTHRNLAGLRLTLVSAGDGFPGSDILFRIRATTNEAAFSVILKVPLKGKGKEKGAGQESVCIHVAADEIVEFDLLAPANQRGPVSMDAIRVETRFPFGLLTAWSWMRPRKQGVCYPRPVRPPYDVSGDEEGESNTRQHRSADLDHAEIRPWRQGDLSQRVLWKRYARTGEMVIADWEADTSDPVWLDYNQFPGADRELRLSYLAALIEDRSRSNELFGLRLPGFSTEMERGSGHRQRCLRALALFGFDAGRRQDAQGQPGSVGEAA